MIDLRCCLISSGDAVRSGEEALTSSRPGRDDNDVDVSLTTTALKDCSTSLIL